MTPLRIAFVAGTPNARLYRQDPAFIYRCENPGLALQDAGHRLSWLHWTALRPTDCFDVVVFHRPRFSLAWRALLWWLHRRGAMLVADVDDLVFDPALAKFSPGVLNGLMPFEKIERQFFSHIRALTCFERVTVSTQPLAEEMHRCLPAAIVKVLPNAVHASWRNLVFDSAEEPDVSAPVITYFPGTRSHDRDFSVYAEGVARFLALHPTARLEVTGPLRFDLSARPGQVVHHEKVPFVEYGKRVRHAWVNLAPLEDTPFTRCKSALKVLEAGFFGVPTVCSPLPDAERFASAGALFAPDGQACFDMLQALINPAHYAAATQGLSARVVAEADVSCVAEEFLQFVNDMPGDGL